MADDALQHSYESQDKLLNICTDISNTFIHERGILKNDCLRKTKCKSFKNK